MTKFVKARLEAINLQSVCDEIKAKAASVGISSAAIVAALSASSAHAALDVTAATTAVSDAQTAMLAVLAAILTLTVGVWGLRKVIGMFGR
ncbi:MAG: major capsid protein [Burkholderiaceae bacterium]|nr:major capsid protein [Burkholderiaceae bacterium]